jgi:phage regulator Rha-like protein
MTNLASIESTSKLSVSDIAGELVIDSRLIAAQLGIQHETVIKSIRKYADKFQQMGVLRFEIGKLKAANRDDLILPVTRNATAEYIKPDDLDEAMLIVFGGAKQGLLKPVGAIAHA